VRIRSFKIDYITQKDQIKITKSFLAEVNKYLPKWAVKCTFSVDICDKNAPRCIYSLVVGHSLRTHGHTRRQSTF
jgi:hypothetical protein